jgi:hypothetical protein
VSAAAIRALQKLGRSTGPDGQRGGGLSLVVQNDLGWARIRLGFLLTFLRVVLYIPIQLAFIPFAIVGLIDALIKEMVISRRLGVSFTAIQSLQYRWFMHYFDTRPDPISVEFIRSFPCESHFGLWSTFGALILSQRLFGLTTKFAQLDEPGRETLLSTPGRRVLVFDEIVEKYVDEMEQIVIPSVGFDLVALHFTKGKSARIFELDQAEHWMSRSRR